MFKCIRATDFDYKPARSGPVALHDTVRSFPPERCAEEGPPSQVSSLMATCRLRQVPMQRFVGNRSLYSMATSPRVHR